MVSKYTPQKGANHAAGNQVAESLYKPEFYTTHLAIPHVAPTRPPYLPRLV